MSTATLTYQLGDRQVPRMGYGAMQLAGKGVFGPQPMRRERFRCCAMPLSPAYVTSIPAIFTGHTSLIS